MRRVLAPPILYGLLCDHLLRRGDGQRCLFFNYCLFLPVGSRGLLLNSAKLVATAVYGCHPNFMQLHIKVDNLFAFCYFRICHESKNDYE